MHHSHLHRLNLLELRRSQRDLDGKSLTFRLNIILGTCAIGQTSLRTGLHSQVDLLHRHDLHRCQLPKHPVQSRSRPQLCQSRKLHRWRGRSHQPASMLNGSHKSRMRSHGQVNHQGATLQAIHSSERVAEGVLLSSQDNGERICLQKVAVNDPVTDSHHGAGNTGARIRTTAVSMIFESTLLPHGLLPCLLPTTDCFNARIVFQLSCQFSSWQFPCTSA